MGSAQSALSPARRCRRAPTRCSDFIPVARFTDMLLNPGGKISLQRRSEHHLSRHPPGLLGGRQSVPPSPGPQPPARRLAQARDHHLPRAVLDAGRARWPTSCCRPPPASSATTSATRAREPFLIAMKKAREPIGEARDDYSIFSEITRRLGAGDDLHRRPRHRCSGSPICTRRRARSRPRPASPSRRSTSSGRPASPRPRARTASR